MNGFKEAREAVEAVVKAALPNVEVYSAWPDGISRSGVVVIQPREPWGEPITLARTKVNLSVKVVRSLAVGNKTAQAEAEQLVWDVLTALRASKAVMVATVGVPSTEQIGTAEAAVIAIDVEIHVEDQQEV